MDDSRIRAALESLQAAEWSATDLDETCVPVEDTHLCPACFSWRDTAHAPDCWLAQTIAVLSDMTTPSLRNGAMPN